MIKTESVYLKVDEKYKLSITEQPCNLFKPIIKASVCTCRFNLSLIQGEYINWEKFFIPQMPLLLKKAHPTRKAEFLAGRYCFMRSAYVVCGERLQIGMDSNRQPIWPETIIGSITHCNDRAIAVTAIKDIRYAGLGIDRVCS